MKTIASFEASKSGAFVQSLLFARNHQGSTRHPFFYNPLFEHLGGSALLTEVTNFGTGGFNYRRSAIPDAAKLNRGTWGVSPDESSTRICTLPSGQGWVRGFFWFRGVCESVPSESFSINEDTPFNAPFGAGLGVGHVQAGDNLIPQVGFQQTYNPTVTIVRIGGVGSFPIQYHTGGLILNRIVGFPQSGAFYFDRIVSASFPLDGSQLFLGLVRTDWSNFLGPSTFEGGSGPGDYIGNEPGFDHGTAWRTSAHYRNDHGHAPSLFSAGNIISDSFLAGHSINLYQFAEVQFLGFRVAVSWEPEQIVELSNPAAATTP